MAQIRRDEPSRRRRVGSRGKGSPPARYRYLGRYHRDEGTKGSRSRDRPIGEGEIEGSRPWETRSSRGRPDGWKPVGCVPTRTEARRQGASCTSHGRNGNEGPRPLRGGWVFDPGRGRIDSCDVLASPPTLYVVTRRTFGKLRNSSSGTGRCVGPQGTMVR